jgi:translation initiation factor 2 subunit 1
MWIQRAQYPEEAEFVICTVTNVHHHTIFVQLDDYKKQGIINISEVSPGRIRNIRDFVVEGKKIVCKVLYVNKERDHIELSLRRVTEMQKRAKMDEIKQEQKAGKIIEFVAGKTGQDFKKLMATILAKVPKDYLTLNSFLESLSADESDIAVLSLDKAVATELLETIKQRIKPSEVEIKGELKLSSVESNGIEIVKEALKKAEEACKGAASIIYLGAGRYMLKVVSTDYKDAEKVMQKAVDAALKSIQKNKGTGEFTRQD